MGFDESWFEEDSVLDVTAEKGRFKEHMDMLKAMPVEEQTLYKKWYEVKNHYKEWHNKAAVQRARVWRPKDIMDKNGTIAELNALRPKLRFISPDDVDGIEEWTVFRVFVSSFNFDQNPGRFLRFMFEDEATGQILGVTSLGSDVVSIGCRDKHIGWTEEVKLGGKLNNTAIGTCIVATQPFGFNFLGGKLMASMLVTPEVRDKWKSVYGDTLAGLTTTSLYGNGSMYNSIPWWKSLGHSAGKIPIKPNDDFYDVWHQIIKKKYPEAYDKLMWNPQGQVATGVKGKILNTIFKEVGIKPTQYIHGFERGVYFAPLYENTTEFLRGEIDEAKLVKKSRGMEVTDVMNWWTPKAINRYTNLYDSGRLNPEVLFYNRMMFMDWPEAKTEYLGDVGR
jgi:hypothetical protein